MSWTDAVILLKVYVVSLLWHFASWPWVSKWFGGLVDKGWAISRVISTLVVAFIVWQLGNFGLRINNDNGVVIIWIALFSIGMSYYKVRGLLARQELIKTAKYIGVEEYLFIVGFIAMTLTRGFAPDIHNLEKFMDFGFINRYLSTDTLPATDMWFAGKYINYYSFGHFWASTLIRTMGVIPAEGYNLVLGIIAGMSLSLTFCIASNLINKGETSKFVGGIIASLTVTIGGNSHAIWYFITHKLTMDNYWYAEATRFIDKTIHEFPAYSFVVSDLHGHLLDLPVVLTFLVIMFYWLIKKSIWLEILMGGILGIMAMTNTWDLAVYGMLLGVVCSLELLTKKIHFISVIRLASLSLLTLITVTLPWWINFESISSGIAVVTTRSPLWQLGVLWTGGVVSIILASISAKTNQNRNLVWSLGLAALILIAIPEFIYAKDIYPNHPRANTMFKLTYQAFIFMGISLGVAVGQIMSRKRSLLKFLGIFFGLVIFTGSMIFPVEAFPSFYGDFKKYKDIDGEGWLKKEMPDRYEVIKYLKVNNDGRNMVEAVGDSYTDYNSISVFSGVPTVLGWRVHEWLWRGGYTPVGDRDNEIKNFYEDEDIEASKDFLEKYKVGWIVVGKDERTKYKLNERKLKKLGSVVMKEGSTLLIKVDNY